MANTIEISQLSLPGDGNVYKFKDEAARATAEGRLAGVKVNNAVLAVVDNVVNIIIAESTANGKINVNNVDIPIKGLAALAYKSEVSDTELSAALKSIINAKAEQSDLNTLSDKIDVLNGTGEGSVDKAIKDAFEEFTTNVTNDDVINSYKELVDWAAEHGGEAADMAASIQALEGLLAGIGDTGQPATVMAAIEAATKDKVDKVSGKGLSTKDFTAAQETKLNGISAGANKTTFSYDENTGALVISLE